MTCNLHTEEEAENLFDEAIRLYEENKLVASLEILKHLLKEHLQQLDEVLLRFYLGQTYYFLDRFVLSLESFLRVLEITDEATKDLYVLRSLYYLGSSLYELARYKESIEYFKKAELMLDLYTPPEWSATRYIFYLRKGRCLLYLGEFVDALEAFKLARVQLEPVRSDSEDAFRQNLLSYEIWRVYVYLKDIENAKRRFSDIDVGLLDDSHLDAYNFTLMKYYLLLGEFKKVVSQFQLYEKSGIGEFDLHRVYAMVARAYLNLGDRTRARKYAELITEDTLPDSEIHMEAQDILRAAHIEWR